MCTDRLGEDEDAVQAYRASVSISEALCEANADNSDWQRRLLIANARLGDILVKQQDREGALAVQQASLAIILRLSARDPANTGLSRDLLLSHVQAGDALVMQLDWERALSEFCAVQAIAKRLVYRDPPMPCGGTDCGCVSAKSPLRCACRAIRLLNWRPTVISYRSERCWRL